jgi:hypothetical protein
MTKQEFISRKQAYQNISGKEAVIAILLLFLFVFLIVGAWDPLCEFVESHVKPANIGNAVSVAIKIIVVLFVMGSFRLLVLFLKFRMKQFGLICTGCGKSLMGKDEVEVMSTGLCGYCGTKVLDDVTKGVVVSVEFSAISDFKSRLKIYQRVLLRTVLIYFFTVNGVIVEIIFLSKRINSHFGFDAISIIVILVSIPVIAVLMFYAIAMPDRRLHQLGLICPTCGGPLAGKASWAVIKTGCCGICGGKVLETLPPDT